MSAFSRTRLKGRNLNRNALACAKAETACRCARHAGAPAAVLPMIEPTLRLSGAPAMATHLDPEAQLLADAAPVGARLCAPVHGLLRRRPVLPAAGLWIVLAFSLLEMAGRRLRPAALRPPCARMSNGSPSPRRRSWSSASTPAAAASSGSSPVRTRVGPPLPRQRKLIRLESPGASVEIGSYVSEPIRQQWRRNWRGPCMPILPACFEMLSSM